MSRVRESGDYEQWILFFLIAIHKAAKDAIDTIDYLVTLHEQNIKKFDLYSKRQKSSILKVLSYLESNPIIDIQKTAKERLSEISHFVTASFCCKTHVNSKIYSIGSG